MSSGPAAIQHWLSLLLRYVRHRTDPFCFFDYISIKASTGCAGKAHLGSAASHLGLSAGSRNQAALVFLSYLWRIHHEQI
jgi:hypothetical protein